jgi:GH24 family phage-related lysozyme (muramidase)
MEDKPSRLQMRNIRDLVPKKDLKGIAEQIRAMKDLWKGTTIEEGMALRRDAEAALVEQAAKI